MVPQTANYLHRTEKYKVKAEGQISDIEYEVE